jgi:hypothetical protein
MSEQNKIILLDLAQQIKDGSLLLEQLPLKWREQVELLLTEGA